MTGKSGPFLAILTALVTFFSAITPARATSDGLIAHWQFDETSGTTAVDSKGGNNGTLTNGPVWQPSGGKIGGAVSLDGTDDYISIANESNFDFEHTDPFSISAWIYRDTNNSEDDIFEKVDGAFGWRGYALWMAQSDNNVRFDITAGSGSYMSIITTGDTVPLGTWIHVVAIYDGSSTGAGMKIYINGVEASTTASGSFNPGDTILNNKIPVIGNFEVGSSDTAWDGLIDDVRIYNRALSAAEVQALYNTKYCAAPVRPEGVMFYNACCKTYQFCNGTDWVPIGSAPQCTSGSLISDLVAHWKLDETSGATLYDTAGNHDATVSGLSLPGDSETGVIDNAIHFYHGDHANAGNITELQGAAQATLSAWIRRENVGNSVRVGKNGGSDTDTFTIDLFGSEVSFKIGVSFNQVGFITLDDTNWHHFALVFDGTQTTDSDKLKGYVDGVEQSLTIWGGPLPSSLSSATGDFLIGNSYDHPGSNGHVDDVRIYDRTLSAAEIRQLSKGMDWVTTGPDPCGCDPSPGDVCADGSVYAGLSPDGNTPMFVARCDAGQTWDGSACTGTRSSLPWNSGNVGYTNTSIADCASFSACSPSGKDNTAILVAEDSQTAGGFQDHQAAKYCSDLTLHGRSDWYLPSAPELGILYDNMTVIGNFDTVWYQSSSEYGTSARWLKNFLSAGETAQAKDTAYTVRCVRK